MRPAIEGVFSRAPLTGKTSVEVPQGWAAVSHRWIPATLDRRWTTGTWFKIESRHGTIYRVLRFAPDLKGTPTTGKGDIAIDWPGWLRLSGFAEQTGEPLKLRLIKSHWWEFGAWMISHPEPSIVLAGIISLISFVLGAISFFISLIALK